MVRQSFFWATGRTTGLSFFATVDFKLWLRARNFYQFAGKKGSCNKLWFAYGIITLCHPWSLFFHTIFRLEKSVSFCFPAIIRCQTVPVLNIIFTVIFVLSSKNVNALSKTKQDGLIIYYVDLKRDSVSSVRAQREFSRSRWCLQTVFLSLHTNFNVNKN